MMSRFSKGKSGFAPLGMASLAVAAMACSANAAVCDQPEWVSGGKVNIAGATLFFDFAKLPALSHDFIDADGDGITTFCDDVNDDGVINVLDGDIISVDQLAPVLPGSFPDPESFDAWWLVQYRSLGSVNGLTEFMDYQACGTLKNNPPAEGGIINGVNFANNGTQSGTYVAADCDEDGDSADDSGTPVCPCSVDLASVDVPTSWGTQFGDGGFAAWDLQPSTDGYGQVPFASWDTGFEFPLPSLDRGCELDCGTSCDGDANSDGLVDPLDSGYVQARFGCSVGTGDPSCDAADQNHDGLVDPLDSGYVQARFGECTGTSGTSLNTNVSAPDACTIYDTSVAWSPIGYIANRGVGRGDFRVTELQHLFVTGRLPSGENLVAATRSAGSGTRNGIMNTSGIDPSWGRGENLGDEYTTDSGSDLGANTQPTNAGGSGQEENAVREWRLAVGYTGMLGSSRIQGDEAAGVYELLNIMNDHVGGTEFVRAGIDNLLDNCDPNTGFVLGGPQTFASRGNPDETNPDALTYMTNQDAADYLRNIRASIASFSEDPTVEECFTPADSLARNTLLRASVDCLPVGDEPTNLQPNPDLNLELQEFTRAASLFAPQAYGTRNPAGKTPQRVSGTYDDGGTTSYRYWTDSDSDGLCGSDPDESALTLAAGVNLGTRNRVQGDFNFDGLRDANDIADMIDAVAAPLEFECGINHPGDGGAQAENVVIPHIIGDFDGNGNFNSDDVRYFADGLAIDPSSGNLDRELGFTSVDNAFGGNYFGTTICTGATYANGDSRADVAGNTAYPGAKPHGHDGVIDAADVAYICDNFGDWSDLDQAAVIDLSADLNGDLVVDILDIDVIMDILGVAYTGDCEDAVAAAEAACP